MRWGNIGHVCPLALPQALLNAQSFLIKRHRDHLGANPQENPMRSGITGIFYPDHIALVEKGASSDINGLLGSCNNEHLLRLTTRGSRSRQILSNGIAQGAVACWVAIGQQFIGGMPVTP